MAKVILKNIVKDFDKTRIINDISLEIKDKEFHVLVGPSGCGKSTILRLIAGLEDITSGEIFIDDIFVNNMLPKNRDIAFVFQSYALYPHMTVFENIAFPLKMRKMAKNDIEKKVVEAAKILDIEHLLKRKPKQLSGGQRQRVALGRAIVRKPKVFLLDEPLSNLDAKLRVEMRSSIKKLHKELDTTFIYVTHDQIEALTMGDKISVINKGEVMQTDSPNEIFYNPKNKFTAGFIGSYPMNFIDVEIVNNEAKLNNIVFKLPFNCDKNKITIGFRPSQTFENSENNLEINAKINFIEILGDEKLVYFEINGQKCTLKGKFDYQVNQEFIICLNPCDFYYFDSITGERIYN
ncbi:MAG: ABC transporter ATP-binding protein [Candidatus Gastranaerophilales bacterium]|nr:ABC transporter ATP-binding protein [Candidatus Gastranaerophilales bacterium]